MQLDETRIVIRQRDYVDLLDLALRVVRAHFLPLVLTCSLGAVPMALLNAWLIGGMTDVKFDEDPEAVFAYVGWLTWLVVAEMPLAAAPTTLYLGQALFQRPGRRRILRDFLVSLPQLVFYQVLVRGVLTLLVVTWFVLYVSYPYLNEVILLERNPLRRTAAGAMTTSRRSRALHAGGGGDLFVRWLAALAIGLVLVVAWWASIFFLQGMLTNRWDFAEQSVWVVHLQAAIWVVASFFTVVRFLSYLDLRIRNEGWEVELAVRAEAARLARQLA
ncbi:MAG: hypothetical protein ACYC35_05090 [Pirellulales bacterium]